MNALIKNPPAFPLSTIDVYNHDGMLLRDYFAAAALQTLPHMGCGADLNAEDTALAAYQIADNMLRARE